ncbi:ABC transporter substrate-binding protein [Streptomyces sp. ODS05-4]|uniref:ABC transporter substrate-binding protein n=1 Tax=Streptomyces sp. ODS05-4 TaxID=2944939 RepID=UPI0027E50624|nr:ABC transporter substrate-binding protein [Streptomyces sp. ODS05-4]
MRDGTDGTGTAGHEDTAGGAGWAFTDDTGQEVRAAARPRRIVAYVRAGAALHDLGVTPVAVYGSDHDGELPDPAKSGGLTAAGVPYLGPGAHLDDDVLDGLRPDLVVDVTYDEKYPYALTRPLAAPLVALSVGGAPLTSILARFADLARGLTGGGRMPRTGADPLAAAEQAVRDAVAAAPGVRVLALSGAGDDQVHLARPATWPELRHLAGLGVDLVEPAPGGGVNWLTTTPEEALRLAPAVVLADHRAHAAPPPAPPGARLADWNPETPPSATASARFLHGVAEALRAAAR